MSRPRGLTTGGRRTQGETWSQRSSRTALVDERGQERGSPHTLHRGKRGGSHLRETGPEHHQVPLYKHFVPAGHSDRAVGWRSEVFGSLDSLCVSTGTPRSRGRGSPKRPRASRPGRLGSGWRILGPEGGCPPKREPGFAGRKVVPSLWTPTSLNGPLGPRWSWQDASYIGVRSGDEDLLRTENDGWYRTFRVRLRNERDV